MTMALSEKSTPSFVQLVLTREYPALISPSTDKSDFKKRSLRLTDTPIYGRDGVSLDELWNSEPGAYMGICPPQMPNLFLFVGPNGAPGAGSTIHMSECVCDYMVKCIQKIQKENLRWMMPK